MNNTNKKLSVREIAMYGLFIALVYIATRFINIPGPTSGGLFHLGNVMFFTIAMVFGKKAGAISGGFGMALFDLTSPYAIWAPFTLVIRFAMGYIIGVFSNMNNKNKTKSIMFNGIGLILASVIMIIGYYIAEGILYHNWIAPVQSIWGNSMQCIVGSVISIPLSIALKAGFKIRKVTIQR